MHMEGGQCPICGSEDIQRKEITKTFGYKGKSFDYPNYVIYECLKCGETVADKNTMKTSGRAIRDFYREVDGLLTSSEIRRIRKCRLWLTQDHASELLGGGAKSFARYENNEVIQSVALDNLLRVLDAYPQAIATVRNKNKPKQEVIFRIPSTFEAETSEKIKAKVVNYER